VRPTLRARDAAHKADARPSTHCGPGVATLLYRASRVSEGMLTMVPAVPPDDMVSWSAR